MEEKDETKQVRKYNRRKAIIGAERGLLRGRAYELWRAGHNFTQIAAQFNSEGHPVDIMWVRARVKEAALAITPEAREIELVRTADRYDLYLHMIWKEVRSGNKKAIDTALKIEKSRRELLGLDAPTRSQIEVSTGDVSSVRDEISAIRARLGLEAPLVVDSEVVEEDDDPDENLWNSEPEYDY